MCSAAGSKGGFVGTDDNGERLRRLRCEHGHVLALAPYEIESKHKMCVDGAVATHKPLKMMHSKATDKNNDIR